MILFDVDNGFDGLVCDDNNWFYFKSGLCVVKVVFVFGGVLVIWLVIKDLVFINCL